MKEHCTRRTLGATVINSQQLQLGMTVEDKTSYRVDHTKPYQKMPCWIEEGSIKFFPIMTEETAHTAVTAPANVPCKFPAHSPLKQDDASRKVKPAFHALHRSRKKAKKAKNNRRIEVILKPGTRGRNFLLSGVRRSRPILLFNP